MLITPKRFEIVLGKLVSNILDGSVSLPINKKALVQITR